MLDPGLPHGNPERTGRYIAVFAEDDSDPAGLLADCGLTEVADTRDLAGPASPSTRAEAAHRAQGLYFAELGIAVLSAEDAQLETLRSRSVDQRRGVEIYPELVHHVLDAGSPGRHRSDAGAGTGGGGTDADAQAPAPAFADTDDFTWGLQAVGADTSPALGEGIKVAVLDTGFDIGHPDFADRTVVTESFVDGEDAQDGHGHGTHCIGTSCGPRQVDSGRGFGVAAAADIYAGKVLGSSGSGDDAGILAGIDWAISQGCAVVSMSLGADVAEVHPPYVAAGKRALARGTLIIAAAGNNAERSAGNPGFVGTPANSPYIMAVGAVDQRLDIADFSARSGANEGGQVDVAGPGVDVYSSWPMPQRYSTISGTSMATPHAAGVAALLAATTGLRGRELWAELVQGCQRLDAASADVGAGLVRAPQATPTDPDPGEGGERRPAPPDEGGAPA
ncbi:S8 family serine peptidase [Arthrobacter sp. JSM 101049]|uniref:S8 family serine peptidase n=1 Tax=Arthrobacter sp. JSM 101049 TaxID=929097 RepID=UPI00356AA808